MALPPFRATVYTQLPERRHTDPPRLWATVILGSVVIHLLLFGMLRLLLMGRLQGFLSDAILVPVDIVTLAPGATSPAPGNQFSVNPPRELSNQTVNRQSSSTSASPSRQTGTQQILTQDSDANRFPNASPVPNVAQNRPSNQPTQPTSPNPSPNVPAEPTSPNTSPNPTPAVLDFVPSLN